MLESKFHLAFLIASTVSKQAVIVPGDRKFCLVYLVIYINESYHKISEYRIVLLIYLVF